MHLSAVKQFFETFVDSVAGFGIEWARCAFVPPYKLHFRRFRVNPNVRTAASDHEANASIIAARVNAIFDIQHAFEVVKDSDLFAVVKAFKLCFAARTSVICFCVKIRFIDIFTAFGAAVHLAVVDSFKGFGNLDTVLSVFVILF